MKRRDATFMGVEWLHGLPLKNLHDELLQILRFAQDDSATKTPVANIGEVAGDGRGRGHHRTNQVRPSAASLTAFEIAIAGRSAAFARLQDVWIHA